MNETRYLRTARLASLGLACATLLGACSLWPLGKSTPAAPDTAAAAPDAPPAVVATAAPCSDCTEGVKPAAVVVAQSPATPVALSPMPAEPVMKAPMAPAPVPPKRMTAAALVHGFYINAGLYAVPGNASKAYSKLESAGLPVFSEAAASKDGPRTRVRVGPYATRAKADAAAKKIRALKLDAVVSKH